MIVRTSKTMVHNFVTGKTYAKKVGVGSVYVYCDGERISDEYSTDEVWNFVLSLVDLDLTKPKKEVSG